MFRTRSKSRFSRRPLFGRQRLWLQSLEDRQVPAIITVTTNADSGAGSLRAALTTAQSNAQDDTITFDTGLVTSPILVTGGELSYAAPSTEGKSLTITWPGAGKLTVQSSGAASTTRRVFNFSDASTTVPSVAISLSNLVITGGSLSSGNGAGILTTNESLSLTNCDVTANTTAGAGAGLAASAATPTITLSGTVFSNNSATSTGGAINLGAAGKLDILASSSFTGNRSGSTGGAIHGASTLTLNITGATFSGNSATSTGGAVHTASTATVTINTSTFSGNTSASSGGAINTASTVTFQANDSNFNSNVGTSGGGIRFTSTASTVTLNRSIVSGNTATSTTGGGIYMFNGGSFTANESSFANNVATTNGGGIATFTASLTLTNSTVSGNEAKGTTTSGGGGISLNSSASLIVNNSTIANNKASGGVGGGIRKQVATGTITLNSTIVAGNTATGGGPDISNNSTIAMTTILGGDNLIGVDDSGNFALSGTNKTGNTGTPLNPQLAPLGNYGGPTLTHGFRYTSPAKDSGNNLAAKTFDQRGTPFNRVVGAFADVGSVEGELTVPFVESATGLTDINGPGGTSYAFTVTFNDETGIDTSKLGTGEVTVTGPAGLFNVAATFKGFTTSGKQVNAAYEFVPPGGSWDVLDGGKYSVNLVAGKLFDTDVPTAQSAPATLIGTFNVGMAGALVVDNAADVDDGNVSAGNLTLREAVRISNASVGGTDTITFSGLNGSTITLVSGHLDVTDGVTITGPGAGNLTISGAVAASATNRIFNINVPGVGGDIKVSGLTMSGGNVTGAGGAINLADETAEFTSVVFTGNKASTNGGAINTAANAVVTLTGCTFTNNTATSSGGAVAIGAGTNLLTVTNSTFTGNSAGVQGGAIQGGSTITLTVSGSAFTSNTATTGGGAMNVGVGTHSISMTTFSKNVGGAASGVGGALNFPSANTVVNLANTSFTSNTAGSTGGAINTGSTITLTIDDSTFTGNFATATGGAVRIASAASTVTVNNSTVSGNTGTGGGGLYFLAGGSLTINNSTIDSNVASTGGGGGIRLGAATVAITNSTIASNTAATTGAGIRLGVTGASLTLANSTVAGNVAVGKGGGVYFIGNTNTVQFDSTIISNNQGATNRDMSGSVATQVISGTKNLFGAYDDTIVTIDTLNNLFGSETAPLDAKLAPLNNFGGPTRTLGLLTGSPAVDNGSNIGGLLFDQRGTGFNRLVGANPDVGAFEGELKIPSANATLPGVSTAGGAVYIATVVYTDETAINTGSIDINDVTLTGGSLVTPLSPTKANVTGGGTSVTVTYEFTPPGGSWDFFDGGVYTLNMIANQVFDTDGPSAVLSGSLGSFVVSIPQTLVVDNVLDEDDTDYSAGDFSLREALRLANTASPGGIDTITFSPALTGSTIFLLTGQIAITDGVVIQGPGSGSLSIAGAATASATNRLFNINIAAAGAKVDISGLTLKSGNVAGTGGAITMVDELLSLNDVTLSGNKASSTGGAISVSTATTITLTNSTFSGNSSGSTGGGISMPATTGATSITVTGSTFSNNTAASAGGAINGGSTVTFTITNSTFTSNTAAGGAGISVTANGVGSSVTGSTFTGSRSTSSGGSISTSGGTLSITDSTISGGSASGNGGAVRFSGSLGTLTVLRSTISGNTSTSASGGGFYLGDHTVTITDSTLSGNTVTGSVGGGAIMSYTATITLTNSTVSGNAASGASVQGGGGIRFSGDGILTIDNSTIVNNSVGSGKGGGIGLNTPNVLVTITSSILAKNSGSIGPDLYSNSTIPMNVLITDSIIGAVTDADITLIETNVQKGTLASPLDPKITVLGNYGGPTQTHGLAFGSPALNMGSNSLTLTNDQRGTGFVRVLGSQADIGAFEGVTAIPQANGSAPDVTTAGGTSFVVTVNYTDDVGIDLASIDVNDITVTTPSLATLTPTSALTSGSGNSVTVTYTFTPPGGAWDSFDSGTYTFGVVGGQVLDLDAVPLSVAAVQLGSFKVAIPASITVDLATDENDGDLTPGDVSLREAILFANSIKGTADILNFSPALGGQTITLTLGEIVINDALTINGLGATKLTISGNNAGRVFNITDGSSATNMIVNLNGLTITGGKNTSGIGGAIIQNGDTLNINNCVLAGNSNTGNGGAIGMTRLVVGENPILNLTNSILSNNTSGASGGFVDGGGGGAIISLVNSTVSGNSATGSGGFVSAGYPNITIKGSTITGNTANNGGGVAAYKATVLVENSTISANTAKTSGGGIYINNGTAGNTWTIRNSTIHLNTATSSGGGITRTGGAAKIVFESSIIAGNLNATTPDVQFNAAGTIDGENNLIGVADVGNFTLNGAINLTGGLGTPLDPLLAPLADNGGAVVLPDGSHNKTHAFAGLSLAINAGSNTASLTFDQRGNARVVGGVADIGAFEQQAPAKFSSVVINNGAVQRSMVTQVKVNFNQHVSFTAGAAAAFTLNRVSDNAAVNLSAVVDDSGSGTAVTLTFTGGAVSGASLADGRYALHILASGFGAEGFDGDGNGIAAGSPADDYFFDQPADPAPLDGAKIFRLFGDSDGSGQVSSADFLAFRLAFLSSSVTFDADGNGQVDSSDFLAFRLNFLKTI